MGKLKKALDKVKVEEVDFEVNSFLFNNVEIDEVQIVNEDAPIIPLKKARKQRVSKTKLIAPISKISKKTKAPKKSGYIKNVLSFFQNYRRQFATVSLVAFAVVVVSLTSYAAYSSITLSNSDILGKVGSHVVLPSGTPKVYIVQSEQSEFLKNPLFRDVRVGDNILNYENAGRVIIYRSKEDRVVNIVNTK